MRHAGLPVLLLALLLPCAAVAGEGVRASEDTLAPPAAPATGEAPLDWYVPSAADRLLQPAPARPTTLGATFEVATWSLSGPELETGGLLQARVEGLLVGLYTPGNLAVIGADNTFEGGLTLSEGPLRLQLLPPHVSARLLTDFDAFGFMGGSSALGLRLVSCPACVVAELRGPTVNTVIFTNGPDTPTFGLGASLTIGYLLY